MLMMILMAIKHMLKACAFLFIKSIQNPNIKWRMLISQEI